MIDSSLSFGLQKKSSLIFGTGKIGSIYPINAYEKIVTTNKEFVKIEDTTIKKSFNCQFSTSLYIEEANLIVAVSAQKSELYVFTLNDVSNPIITNFSTNQLGIFHMIYSKRSSVLLTFGFGVKIWNLNITMPDRRRSTLKPIVNISLRYSFSGDDSISIKSPEVSNYEASILIPPSFDYSEEIVFLPSSKGILGYDMNGKQKTVMYRLPSSNKTAYCYLEEKKEMLIYDNANGLILCTTSGLVQSRPLVGNTTLIWMDFLDTENALLMDAKGVFYILDLKTGRSFHCYSVLNSTSSASTITQNHDKKPIDPTLSMMAVLGQSNSMSGLCEINGGCGGLSTAKRMPSRVFLLRNSKEVCMCFGPRLETFKIDIPWTLWAVNISKTNSLKRIEKPGEAARVLAFTSNSFVKIFSPKDGKILTDATPKSLSSPSDFFYDRGYLIYYQSQNEDDKNRFLVKRVHETQTEERLFVILDDGSISIFDPNQNPCKEIGSVEIKAKSMTVCYFNNEFCYAISSSKSGEVYLVDSHNFQCIKKKFLIAHDSFCNLIFDPISGCLICVMSRETALFDLRSQKVVYRLDLKGTKLVSLNNGILYYGYPNGDINFVSIQDNSLVLMTKEPNRLHFDSVTGFAFSQSFWISVSADQTVRYWDYLNNNFFTINMPCRLFGCEIINGKRDVVVGTDNELMLIDGKTVFDGEIDEIEPIVDNFDNECDDFQKVIIENVMRMKREEEKREFERRKKQQERDLMLKKKLNQKDDRAKQKHKKLNLNEEELTILNRLDIKNSTKESLFENKPKNESDKVEKTEMTEELKAQLKEEEEKRRNKAFEAMLEITDHDRRFRQKALSVFNANEKEKTKKNDANGENLRSNKQEWSIKINSNSNHDSLSSSSNNQKNSSPVDDMKGEIVKSDSIEKVQITAPSVIMKAETAENAGSSHAPRRKRKRKVHHTHDEGEMKTENGHSTFTNEIKEPSENKQQPPSTILENSIKKSKEATENKVEYNHIELQTNDKKPQNETEIKNYDQISIQKDNRNSISIESTITTTIKSSASDFTSQYSFTNQKHDCTTSTNNTNSSQDSAACQLPQPPLTESTSSRSRKLGQSLPRRENIGTSPIDFEVNEDDQNQLKNSQQPQLSRNKEEENNNSDYTKPAKVTKSKQKKESSTSLSNPINFLRKKGQKFTFRPRFPTPPQVLRRSFISKFNDRRKYRPRSSQGNRKKNGFFEMPSPQIVLDIDAVRSEFGRGKVELFPLVQRIENDTAKINTNSIKMSISKPNENNSNSSVSSSSDSSMQAERVRPLIEQNKKQIYMPLASCGKRNKSLGKIRAKQFPSRTARRPLGHYENSVTVMNSANPTPRQLIPKFKKSSSSVENKKNQNAKNHHDKDNE